VPSRKTPSNRARGRSAGDDAGTWAGALRSLLARLGWGVRETVAVVVGGCGAVAIVVNALFLQSGPHPAPFFNSAPPLDVPAETSVAVAMPRARPPDPPPPAPRSETAPAKRVVAMQRALAQFGYGQIKPTGVVDGETRAAIEKFERDHRLPVTGQLSERLTRELTAMTGRSLD
jgi:putative peptidoglycan binding protein